MSYQWGTGNRVKSVRHAMSPGSCRRSAVLARGLLLVLAAMAAASCATRRDQLEQVAKDWCETIRASQVIPVYPPTEDLQPGDVLLVSVPIDEQVEVYDEKGFLPMDQLLVRLGLTAGENNWGQTVKYFYGGRYETSGSMDPPAQWQESRWDKAPRAAFPTYGFSVKRGSGLNLALPISGVPFGLSLMQSDAATGTVTLSDVATFGLDNFQLHEIVSRWTRQHRDLLRSYEPRGDDRHFLRVVSRIYVAGSVDVGIHNDASTGVETKVGADTPVTLLGIEAQNPDANFTSAMGVINELAEKVAPGGALKFASASSRSVSMNQKFPRPLVIGYVGFDLPIEFGGRTGAPISTLAQLSDARTLPAARGVDNIYKLAALNHLYLALTEFEHAATTPAAEKAGAAQVRSKLDCLAAKLPRTCTFTFFEPGEDGTITRNAASELPIEGHDLPRNRFSDVTDYLANAQKTIAALEDWLASAPKGTSAELLIVDERRDELAKARAALAEASPILQGNPDVLEAVDFLFLPN